MAIKNYLKTMIVVLVLATNVNAQINDTEYEMTKTYAIIDPTMYVKAMNRMFKFDTLCLDDILITHINGNKVKNKYVTYSEIRTYLTKRYYKPDEKTFKFSSETNNGYVIVIGQYGKDPDIAIRYYTIFLEQTTGKITVIEIEENK